jgi:phosphatidylglycerophosphate synthase
MEHYTDPDRPLKYSYKSINHSLINAFYKRYWLPYAFKLVPERISANLISIIGSLGAWLAFLLLSGFLVGPMWTEGRSFPWLFGLAALLIFFYHTMDNLDGMQARRTRSTGPLGEFVDHWFDSFNTFLLPLGLGLAFPVIPPVFVAVSILLCCLADWLSARSVRNSGVLRFGPISSEEALLFSYLFCLAIWAFGYDFWAAPGPFGIPRVLFVYSLAPIAFLACIATTFKPSDRPDLPALMLSCVIPIFAWTILAIWKSVPYALLSGCLLMGFTAARFAGDVLRDRLVGLEYRGFYVDIVAMDLLLLGCLVLPGLPAWALPAMVALAFVWTFCALALQFSRTVARVREVLGKGLFGPAREVEVEIGNGEA